MAERTLTPREISIDFDELKRIMEERSPGKKKFLKSKRCKILVVVGILLTLAMLALLATTYAIAITATTTSAQTSSPTTSTVSTPTYQRITQLNDQIGAIYNAAAGALSFNSMAGNGTGNYEPGHGPDACIDFADTTYLNYGNVGYNTSGMTNTAGVGTGIHTIPQVGASIVQSVQFQAGNNSADRDPLSITLEGSNATGTNLNIGSSWSLLYTGPTGLAPFTVTRLAWGELQNFTNSQVFTAYRLIVTSQRGVDYCTEYAEIHLYGIV